MPTYDYECDACGHRFEMFQTFSERVRRKCPVCDRLRLRRLIGAGGGIIFKGSGFYETDYKRGNKNNSGPPGTSKEKPKEGSEK